MRPKENPVDNLDMEMDSIRVEISKIDAEVQKLKRRRQHLVDKYENLKEAKMIKDSAAVSLDEDWDKETFEWSNQVRETMKTVFNLNDFRPQQLQAINCIMSKKDVLMIAPTGGGKSLCYQLPAVLSDGITIVVSPLISLMEDQVWSMNKIGINAELLSASTDNIKNSAILKQMCGKEPFSFKLLYVTPERLAKSRRFMNALQKCYLSKKLNFIAIDEVHCCSQWGHDFRPDYKLLGTIKTLFADLPVLGVTATATAKVLIDIQKMLNLNVPVILKAEFNRPNLYYHVIEKPSEKDKCTELLYNLLNNRYKDKSGIIYAFSIADTEKIAAALVLKGLNVRPYHANLTADRRTRIHSKWLSGIIQAVVATVAFGMGIDKPNVRFVIHHTLSKSMEHFYQESGRAGRDGLRAECVLLYRSMDAQRITSLMFAEHTGLKNAYEMIEFAIDGFSCRRDLIGKHFLEVWNESIVCNKMCDRCYYKDSVHPPKMNIVEHCLSLYKIIDHASSLDVNLTFLKLVDNWFGKVTKDSRVKSVPVPDLDRFYAEQMITFLVIKEYLKEEFAFSAFKTHSYIKKGPKVACASDRIMFYGARVLNLPDCNDKQWYDEDCYPFVSTEIQPPAKKVKKEKTRKCDEKSRRKKSIDTSFNESADEMNLPKLPKKKRKSEKHHKPKLDTSADCKVLVDTSDIIEID